MSRIIRICFLLATTSLVLAPAVGANASGTDHRGTRTVCVNSTWVEKAPADHPFAPAYRGDRFEITRADFATVHHSDGSVQRWAKGTLIHHDSKADRTDRYRGWIRVSALAMKCR
jgi:hypothetical protein